MTRATRFCARAGTASAPKRETKKLSQQAAQLSSAANRQIFYQLMLREGSGGLAGMQQRLALAGSQSSYEYLSSCARMRRNPGWAVSTSMAVHRGAFCRPSAPLAATTARLFSPSRMPSRRAHNAKAWAMPTAMEKKCVIIQCADTER